MNQLNQVISDAWRLAWSSFQPGQVCTNLALDFSSRPALNSFNFASSFCTSTLAERDMNGANQTDTLRNLYVNGHFRNRDWRYLPRLIIGSICVCVWYVYMCACLHVCMYVGMQVCMLHVCMYARMYACMHARIHLCICVSVYLCICVCVCLCVCVSVSVCVCAGV